VKPDVDYTLYLVTDEQLLASGDICSCVARAIEGGCTVVQLRDKTAGSRALYETAVKLRTVAARYGVPLIINDRADIAAAAGADGVHLGRGDLPYAAARRIMGDDKIIGLSASNMAEAAEAEKTGADYIGVGAMFKTATKTDAYVTTFEELKRIRAAVRIPIVAIGGINAETAHLFGDTGVNGVAAVSAIVGDPDPYNAARRLKSLFLNARG